MREKSLFWAYLIILLLSSMVLTNSGRASEVPKLYVDPPTSVANPSQEFTVDINITNALTPGIAKWEFWLRFDPRILHTDKGIITPDPDLWFRQDGAIMASFFIYVSTSYIRVSGVHAEPGPGTTGSGTLAEVTFNVRDTGQCTLHLSDITLKDPDGNPISPDTDDGTFYTNIPRAGCTVKPSEESYNLGTPEYRNPGVGETVTFNASYDPTLKDYSSYDPDGEIVSWSWDFGENTPIVSGEVVTHAYTAAGPYTVNLTVTDNDGYTNTELKYLSVELHDIAITDIKVSPTIMRPGQLVSINVTLANEGLYTEYFNITCYYDNTAIWYNETYNSFNLTAYSSPFIYNPATYKYGIYLEPNENMTVTFIWNTTGVAEGTYTIRANASLVDEKAVFLSGETDIADNEKTVPDIIVNPSAPMADFIFWPEHPMLGKTVTFDASSSNDTPPGWIESYTWDFGDNTPIVTVDNATKVVTHSYGKVETYHVTLNVTDNESFSVTRTKSVTVSVHDIAILDISVSPETQGIVIFGENASIYVRVRNEGDFDETFNVTAYCDGYFIEPTHTNVILKARKEKFYEFTWNTTGLSIGAHTISANVSVVPNEINTTNNFKIADRKLSIIGHNIAMQSIDVSPTTVAIGNSVSINVTVKNVGSFSETFNVTAYYDGIAIETLTSTNLKAGADTTLTFIWDTTGVTVHNYTIEAEASNVPDETDTTDNTKIYGIVTVEKMSSSISITASPTTITVGDTITISGTIDPTRVGATVTIWFRSSEAPEWNELATMTSNETSQYSYPWTPQETGTYEVRASWPGDPSTRTDESDVQTVTVKETPTPSIILYAAAGILILVGATVLLIYFIKVRKRSSLS